MGRGRDPRTPTTPAVDAELARTGRCLGGKRTGTADPPPALRPRIGVPARRASDGLSLAVPRRVVDPCRQPRSVWTIGASSGSYSPRGRREGGAAEAAGPPPPRRARPERNSIMHDPAPTPARRGPVAAARWSNPRPRPSAPSAMGGARGRVGPRPAPHGISLPPDPVVSASVPHANEERAGGGARAPTSRFGGNEIRAPRARWPSPGPRSRPPDVGTNGTAGGPRAARLAAPPLAGGRDRPKGAGPPGKRSENAKRSHFVPIYIYY